MSTREVPSVYTRYEDGRMEPVERVPRCYGDDGNGVADVKLRDPKVLLETFTERRKAGKQGLKKGDG